MLFAILDRIFSRALQTACAKRLVSSSPISNPLRTDAFRKCSKNELVENDHQLGRSFDYRSLLRHLTMPPQSPRLSYGYGPQSVWGWAVGPVTILWGTLSFQHILTHGWSSVRDGWRRTRAKEEVFWLFVISASTPTLAHSSSFISLCLPVFILCTCGLITYVLTSCFLQINLYFRNISGYMRRFLPKLTTTHSVVFFVLESSVYFFFFNLNTFEVYPNTRLAFCKHIFWSELHLPWFHMFYRSFWDIYITIMKMNILLTSCLWRWMPINRAINEKKVLVLVMQHSLFLWCHLWNVSYFLIYG